MKLAFHVVKNSQYECYNIGEIIAHMKKELKELIRKGNIGVLNNSGNTSNQVACDDGKNSKRDQKLKFEEKSLML